MFWVAAKELKQKLLEQGNPIITIYPHSGNSTYVPITATHYSSDLRSPLNRRWDLGF